MSLVMILIAVAIGLLLPTAYAGYIGAPYAPTRRAIIRKTFDALEITSGHTLIELGVGDGTALREAAQRGGKALGWELSPILWLIARWRLRRQSQASVRYGNFYKQNLSQHIPAGSSAVDIFTFLMPDNMPRLRRFLAQQSIPQARFFLSYAFPLKSAEPIQVIREPNCGPMYVYDLQKLVKPQNVSATLGQE